MKIRERLEKLVFRKSEVEALLSDPETLQNSAKVQKLTRELAQLRPLLEKYAEYKKEAADRKALESDTDSDPEIQKMVFEEKRELDEKLARLQIEMEDLLLKGSEPDASRDVIMEIRAGTGGEEAALFVGDLYRMYERYAARHGLKGTAYSTVNTALYAASLRAGKKDMILVCGSIFLAGEISLDSIKEIWRNDDYTGESWNFLEVLSFFR